MIPILVCLIALWHVSEASYADHIDFTKYHMVGDMVLPINEGDRSLTEAGKYWIENGVPTVLYTIDPEIIKIEETVRNSLNNLELKTCFKYIRVPHNDTRHKLYYFNGGDARCYSNVGNVSHINQTISIGAGCNDVLTVTHETMHSMGFTHTQSRSDRDDNIIVNFQNLKSSSEYAMKNTVLNGTVYDFRSVMHYLDYFLGNGKGPTFVTRDPSHNRLMRAAGRMTQSEAFSINSYYDCFKHMGKNCSDRECHNGGFIINDCTCFCPGNFTGPKCETFAGAWFNPGKLDRKLDEPGMILTRYYPFDNNQTDAMTWARLPRCFYPRIKLLNNDLIQKHWDDHWLRIEDKHYQSVSMYNMPFPSIINGSGSELVLHQTTRHTKPGRGIQMAVDFIPDGQCTKNYTDFSRMVCIKLDLPRGSWSYESPNYPDITNRGVACKINIPVDKNSLATFSITLDSKLEMNDRLEISYVPDQKISLKGPTNFSIGFVSTQGMEIKFKTNREKPGYFKVTADTQRVPKICNTVTKITSPLTIQQPFTEWYPQCGYPYGAMCNMLFQAAEGKKIKITFNSIDFLEKEYFLVYAKAGLTDFRTVTKKVDPIVSDNNEMLVTYAFFAQGKFSPYEITISAE